MRKAIDNAFLDLNSKLREYETTRSLADEEAGYALAAVTFLQRNQNSDGSWSLGAMLNTTLSLQALSLWALEEKAWKLPDGTSGGLEHAYLWLDNNQDGQVWENIWNTAGILQAAYRQGQWARPSVVRAWEWLQEEERTKWGLEQGLPPHQIAQAVITLSRCGADPRTCRAARDHLIEHLRKEGVSSIRSVYSAGQVLEALSVSGCNPATDYMSELSEYVSINLINTEVSISNFLDICAGFKGIGAARGGIDPDEPAIDITLSKFFSGHRLRDDGSWYRDLTLTAYALLALTEVRKVRKIEAFPNSIYSHVDTLHRKVLTEYGAERRERAITTAGGFISGLLLIVALGLFASRLFGSIPSLTDDDLELTVLAAAVSSLFTTLLFTVRRLR